MPPLGCSTGSWVTGAVSLVAVASVLSVVALVAVASLGVVLVSVIMERAGAAGCGPLV